MGIGDNFDTSNIGLRNARTGRKSGHGHSWMDDNGGHPCNIGCGCKEVFYGAEGNCSLPPEIRVSILQVPSYCSDNNTDPATTNNVTTVFGKSATADKTATQCEANNGVCKKDGSVISEFIRQGATVKITDKYTCEDPVAGGTWETSGTFHKTSRTVARQNQNSADSFLLRYKNGAWRGRRACRQTPDPYLNDSGSSHRMFGKEGHIYDPVGGATPGARFGRTSRGKGTVPRIDSMLGEAPREAKFGTHSLRSFLIQWLPNDLPYGTAEPVHIQKMKNIILMGSEETDTDVMDKLGASFDEIDVPDEDPINKVTAKAGKLTKVIATANPFLENYKEAIAVLHESNDSYDKNLGCLQNGERFHIPHACARLLPNGDMEMASKEYQVCYKEVCTGADESTKSACENKNGAWDIQFISDSEPTAAHETSCEASGGKIFTGLKYLDESECAEEAKCLTEDDDEQSSTFGELIDAEDDDGNVITDKYECLARSIGNTYKDLDPADIPSVGDFGGTVEPINHWTHEWQELHTDDAAAITNKLDLIVGSSYSAGNACCDGHIDRKSPGWHNSIRNANQYGSRAAEVQNTCTGEYEEVTLIPGRPTGSVVDITGGTGGGPSFHSSQRADQAQYDDMSMGGFTLVHKPCTFYGNCFAEGAEDAGVGQVTVLRIPMDQIMNCSNLRLTDAQDKTFGWKEQFGWWGNPAGFYPGDPQEEKDIPFTGRHLNYCHTRGGMGDGNDDGVADWTSIGKQTHSFYGNAGGEHWDTHANTNFNFGSCAIALYWENQMGLVPHNSRSFHKPGDWALRKLNLQPQPFKATEAKQNSYKSLREAQTDKNLFDLWLNSFFLGGDIDQVLVSGILGGQQLHWHSLAYWFEHDWIAYDLFRDAQGKIRVGDLKAHFKRIGDELKAANAGKMGRFDHGGMGSVGGPRQYPIWNIFDHPRKRTDGWLENGEYPDDHWEKDNGFKEGYTWHLITHAKTILGPHASMMADIYHNRKEKGKVHDSLDYWGRTGLYPTADEPSYVVNTCLGAGPGEKIIEAASNTTPIVIRSTGHSLKDGDHIQVKEVSGNLSANVMTLREFMEEQWGKKLAAKCEAETCDDPYYPFAVCPCNGPKSYKDASGVDHCSGVTIKGEDPPPADFFVVKIINSDEFALYTCDGFPVDGRVNTLIGADFEKCESANPDLFPRLCASTFASAHAVPTTNSTVTLNNGKYEVVSAAETKFENESTCQSYGNCLLFNPPYGTGTTLTESECSLLASQYDHIDVDVKDGAVTYKYYELTGGAGPACGNECFEPLQWITEKNLEAMQGKGTDPEEGGLSNYPYCPFTGYWRQSDIVDPYMGPPKNDYRIGWKEFYKKDTSKAEDYYVWMDQEETCPVCCDHFMPKKLKATVAGHAAHGASTMLNSLMLIGSVTTTMHDPDSDVCMERPSGSTGGWSESSTIKDGMSGIPAQETWQDQCKSDDQTERELVRGKKQQEVPCGINKCTGEFHPHVINYWGLPIGGEFCCDCGTYNTEPLNWGPNNKPAGPGHHKCFKCSNAIRFNDNWKGGGSHISHPNSPVWAWATSGASVDKNRALCCEAECNPGEGAGTYPTAQMVMDAAPDGCNHTIGNLTCKTMDVGGSGSGGGEEGEGEGGGESGDEGGSGGEGGGEGGGGEGGGSTYEMCICGEDTGVAGQEGVPCFGFPNGRPMKCEPPEITGYQMAGCPSGKEDVHSNAEAQGDGCGEPNTFAMPTTECYDFVPRQGIGYTGGDYDIKDGCSGLSSTTIDLNYNGSHWVSNWEPMMGDSPSTRKLGSGLTHPEFVGGMSCNHYPNVGAQSICAAGYPGCVAYDQATCKVCGGKWLDPEDFRLAESTGGDSDLPMDGNCGQCATRSFTGYKKNNAGPPVPTPSKDAFLMRFRLGCGGNFQQYYGSDVLKNGDYYQNNQLNMYIEVSSCKYNACNKLAAQDAFRPPCPNSLIINDPKNSGGLTVDRDGKIEDTISRQISGGSGGDFKLAVNGGDPYWNIPQCIINGPTSGITGYCRYKVRGPAGSDAAPNTIKPFDCNKPAPPIEDLHQTTTVAYCHSLDDKGTCEGKELDPFCYAEAFPEGCTGEFIPGGRGAEFSGTEWDMDNCPAQPADLDWVGSTPTVDLRRHVNPSAGFNDCYSIGSNIDFVFSDPSVCDAAFPCTECCEFNPTPAGYHRVFGGTQRTDYITCAVANELTSRYDGGPYGLGGTQIPDGRFINLQGGKSPENFEVVGAYPNDYGTALVVKKNNRNTCGWQKGTPVSIGLADKYEAEHGNLLQSTRNKLSRNWNRDANGRMVTSLSEKIPNGEVRYARNPNSEYMEIIVKDGGQLISRAHAINNEFWNALAYKRPIDRFGAGAHSGWPYDGKLGGLSGLVAPQSDTRVPSTRANDLHMERLGQTYIRNGRRGFHPTMSNILDDTKAVFLSEIPKMDVSYPDNDTSKTPKVVYYNEMNMSLSIINIENIYDPEQSYCTNPKFTDEADCNEQGVCKKIDMSKPESNYIVETTDNKTDCERKAASDPDYSWVRTSWWKPKFLYTEFTTYRDHDLLDGERIIISGSRSHEAKCLNIKNLPPDPAGSAGGGSRGDLPQGWEMSDVDQNICESVLGGTWSFDFSDMDTAKKGCPPLCDLDKLIGRNTCGENECPDCVFIPAHCSDDQYKSKVECEANGEEWTEDDEYCFRSSFDGHRIVGSVYDDEGARIPNKFTIVKDAKIPFRGTSAAERNSFVDITKVGQIGPVDPDENGCSHLDNEQECNAHTGSANCKWRNDNTLPAGGECYHLSECAKMKGQNDACSASPWCEVDVDENGADICVGGVTRMDKHWLQTTDVNMDDALRNHHGVSMGSPYDLYRGEEYFIPTADSAGNYGPYFGGQWSRGGGTFNIRVGQEVALDDCRQGGSDTPTNLKFVFPMADELCNHYLPAIDTDISPLRGYGPYTEPTMDINRPFGFPARAFLRVDIHEGSSPVDDFDYPWTREGQADYKEENE